MLLKSEYSVKSIQIFCLSENFLNHIATNIDFEKLCKRYSFIYYFYLDSTFVTSNLCNFKGEKGTN